MSHSHLFYLILRYSVPKDFIVSYAVLVHPAAIAGVALYGVNNAVFDLLHDADVIGLPVLRAGVSLVIPVKEDNHSGDRLGRTVHPLSTVFEPLDTIDAACKLGNNSGIDIAALVGAPRYKAGTPFHTASKAISRPVRLTANIADLRKCHGDDLIVAVSDAVQHRRPNGVVLVFEQFRKVFPLLCVKAVKVSHFLYRLMRNGNIERRLSDCLRWNIPCHTHVSDRSSAHTPTASRDN